MTNQHAAESRDAWGAFEDAFLGLWNAMDNAHDVENAGMVRAFAHEARNAAYGLFPNEFPDLVSMRCRSISRMARDYASRKTPEERDALVATIASNWPDTLRTFTEVVVERFPQMSRFAEQTSTIDVAMARLRVSGNY